MARVWCAPLPNPPAPMLHNGIGCPHLRTRGTGPSPGLHQSPTTPQAKGAVLADSICQGPCASRCQEIFRQVLAGVRQVGRRHTRKWRHTGPRHGHADSNSAHTTRPGRSSEMSGKVFGRCRENFWRVLAGVMKVFGGWRQVPPDVLAGVIRKYERDSSSRSSRCTA